MRNFRHLILLVDFLLKGQVFIALVVLLACHPAKANDDNSKLDWMNSSLEGLKTLFASCLEVPKFNSFQEGSISLDLAKPNEWNSTGNYVKKDKAIKFDWSTRGSVSSPRRYRVMYRIDPRFNRPQIFIKTFNHLTKKYEATNFPKFKATDPTKDYTSLAFSKMQNYVDYFNFANNRQKIRVEKGDVINITLAGAGDFFSVATDEDFLKSELDNNMLGVPSLYTNSNLDNKILYSTAEKLCDSIDPSRDKVCQGTGANTKYKVLDKLALVGKPLNPAIIQDMNRLAITICPDFANDKDNSPVCFYDQGRGMRILVNNQIIKREAENFVYSKFLKKSFLYYKSDIAGDLDFLTDWLIQGMFTSLDKPLMSDWTTFSDLDKLNFYINSPAVDLSSSFLHFGRYIMMVEVGNGDKTVSDAQQKDIEVEYIIVKGGGTPLASLVGTQINQDFSTDADKDGYLWIRVKNPNKEVMGLIKVNYANYTGSTWFSDIVYKGAVKPITDEFHKFTMNFYTKLTKNVTLHRIIKAALILYVIIYALTFLAGAIQITAKDLLTRIIKITLIVILIGDDSWNFFNNYLFNAFIKGTDYLMTNVVGLTSSKANIFGFIDPIFDKYTNGRFWGLLFIQLLQIHNGLALVAIMTIYSLTLYFRAILEVIIGYVIAYIGLAIMISLAPLFIILVLFEKTKSIFDNWLSTLFSYMMQPTILLIFFLLIDQVMSEQLLKIVVRACWNFEFIPIAIGLDLTHMDIPINFSFKIPFLPGIPFFVPEVTEINNAQDLLNSTGTFLVIFTSSLLFYAYCLMCYGLVDYVTIVVAQLTNVTPARQEGDFQRPSNPTQSIIQDMESVAKPVKDLAFAPARIFKDKVIDQNYKARKSDPDGKKEYTGKIFASRNDSDTGGEAGGGSNKKE
ncbi:type IV secretion system protein [Candidatus Tisiphia endosymbiont of Nedyus quadrimaculatus]|uniref:type IV secretion system protein n=1 Tax=Candidatus Tisiphia endosymbiont of Nedyus quadrimaculatus TaxID=3139332 RepID=UPI00345E0FB7